jgi:hypothetical protein
MNLKPVLILSVVGNIALLGAVGYFATSRGKVYNEAKTEALLATKPDQRKPGDRSRAQGAVTDTMPNRVVQRIDWRSVESEDYRKYITNLRSIGCPEETIRDIITADVNKLFKQRARELSNSGTNRFEFWKPGNPFAGMLDPEKMEKQQQLAKEKRELLKELLGVAPEEKLDMFAGANPFEAMLDFLPDSKQNQVMELFSKYQAKMMKTMGKGGAPDSDDMKKVRESQKEMERELAGILTPQELEDYQLRMSQTAMAMRMSLASFDPKEEEFRKIFDVKKKFDDEFGAFNFGDADDAEKAKRKAAEKEMNDQLKGILGDERYAEYERSQDWNFQTLYRLTEKNGLEKEAANKVYDMKKVAEQEAKKIRDDKSLTPEQRTASLKAIRAETEASMGQVLGDKTYKSYEKQAWWLNSISPKVTATASGSTQ